MLEGMERIDVSNALHRMANLSRVGEFAQRKGLNFEQAREIVAFMGEKLADELLRSPFEPKNFLDPTKPFGATRFSDGTWPVFYGAIDEDTAAKECLHHYAKAALGDPASARSVYYSVLHCLFQGSAIDLRPKKTEWPDLVAEDYRFCQGLGKEAIQFPLESFLAPSARQPDGTTTPVFAPRGLSNPTIGDIVRFGWDSDTGAPTIERTE